MRSTMLGGSNESTESETLFEHDGVKFLITKTYEEGNIELSFVTIAAADDSLFSPKCVSIFFSDNTEDRNPIISEQEIPNSYAYTFVGQNRY